ncbi:MAG TPA: universal stress protein [Thermodesulfobacteriota bacterium]|nr:universal stress protein [Thermodesulfobacteriota bacterium]
MEIKKILWATDGSKEAEEALSCAAFLAGKFGSEMAGIYVSEMPVIAVPFYADFGGMLYSLVEKEKKENKERLNSIAEDMSRQGLRFRGEVIEGEANKEIIECAYRENADLIVMGKRGLGLIDRVLVGSTTSKVLRQSKVPVLAFRRKGQEDTVDIRDILVPIDIYSDKTDSALRYALELAARIGARLSVVYVFSMDAVAYEIPPSLLENLISQSAGVLGRIVERVKNEREAGMQGDKNLEITAEVIHGISPAISIVEYASKNNVDLILINTHGRKGVRRLILGSVTERVIQESPCAVLAIKP